MAVDEPPVAQPRFTGFVLYQNRLEFWSPEEMPHTHNVVGTAGMIGEECFMHTRFKLNACRTLITNAINTQLALSDAPRQFLAF